MLNMEILTKKNRKSFKGILAVGLSMVLAVTASGNVVSGKTGTPSITATKVSLVKGKTKTITIQKNGAAVKKVTWKSSNKKIATVKAKGKLKGTITAVKKGTATITAAVSYKKGKKTASKKLTCKVAVKDAATQKSPEVEPTLVVPGRTEEPIKPPTPVEVPKTIEPIKTAAPTEVPRVTAEVKPTVIPTLKPTATVKPTAIPTLEPPTPVGVLETIEPIKTVNPTEVPRVTAEVKPTVIPTLKPTATVKPTAIPTLEPPTPVGVLETIEPIKTVNPTEVPRVTAEVKPTVIPTLKPTATVKPTAIPTLEPPTPVGVLETIEPIKTVNPTEVPETIVPIKTATPTEVPRVTAEVKPTVIPTLEPTTTVEPTAIPTLEPPTNSTFAGGDGTEQSPYQIRTLKQLQEVSQYNGCHFVQVQDIDVDYGSIEPLFPSGKEPFNGVYDGGGYAIANYNYANGDAKEISIFGEVGKEGIIKNLTIEDSFLTTESGAVLVYKNKGIILDCKVLNTNVRISHASTALICAYNNGTMRNCSAEGIIVYNSSSNEAASVGGVSGYNTGNIYNCTATCNIAATKGDYKDDIFGGGIAGRNKGMVKDCLSESVVSVKNNSSIYSAFAGGVVGLNDGQIINCFFLKTEEDIIVDTRNKENAHKGLITGAGDGIVS